MQNGMTLIFSSDGQGHCLYGETIDLHALGRLSCRRASHVEFDEDTQEWQVLTADRSGTLFRSQSREACLDWEKENLSPE